MSQQLTKLIVDVSKPKGQQETILPLSAEEIAQLQADRAAYEIRQAERDAVQQAQEAAKASAEAKLAALGLTPAEVSAIVGL